jgi:prepilin-type processing-associated H-X9-DG protein/prepilin-type N-terminal cleavage/methylation domain-containing protein
MKKGFTLTEILVVAAILVALAAIIIPVMNQAKSRGVAAQCMSSIRQLTAAQLMYTQASDGKFAWSINMDEGYWLGQLKPYGGTQALSCPKRTSGMFMPMQVPLTGFAINSCFMNALESSVQNQARTISFAETTDFIERNTRTATLPSPKFELLMPDKHYLYFAQQTKGLPEPIPPFGCERHSGGSNYAFLDGHAKWYMPTQIRFTPKYVGCSPREERFPGTTPEEWTGPTDGPSFRFLP